MKKNVFNKLVGRFLLIIIPIIIIGIILISLSIDSMEDQIIETSTLQSKQIIDRFKIKIENINKIMYATLNNRDINDLSIIGNSMELYYRNAAMLRVKENLFTISNSNSYISSVRAYINTLETVISNEDLPTNFTQDDRNVFIDTDKFIQLDNHIITDDNDLYIRYYHLSPSRYDNRVPIFALETRLSLDDILQDMIASKTTIDSGTSIILNASDSSYIINDLDTDIDIINKIIKEKNKESIGKIFTSELKFEKTSYIFISFFDQELDIRYIQYINKDNLFKGIKLYYTLMILFVIISVIMSGIFLLFSYHSIKQPLVSLIGGFKKMQDKQFDISIPHSRDDEFGYLYQQFNKSAETINELINKVYQQELLNQKAELKQLQAQINPHFLYNSFFLLSRMIKGENFDNAVAFSKQLGEYFKYITKSVSGEVRLEDEVKHARIYAQIQAMRFSRRILLNFDEIPKEFSNILVLRLLVQPILENTFEHGLKNKVSDGIVQVTFEKVDKSLHIIIEDNGEELRDEDISNLNKAIMEHAPEYSGLTNIYKRLLLRYEGGKSRLKLSRSSLGGLKSVIIIDIE